MIVRFTRMHILLSLPYSAQLWNNFMCISVSEGPRSSLTWKSCSQIHHQGCWLMSLPWCHIPSGFKHMNSPSMTSAFQQGKPMQWGFGKGKEMGNSLHSGSPVEQPPTLVKICMLCQNLCFKCLTHLVKVQWKIRVWESIQSCFCYHRWVLVYDTAVKYLARKMFPPPALSFP